MADQSNAGPFDISPQGSIAPGEEYRQRFEETQAGPANKEGFLTKLYGERGGLDYIFVVNSSPELIRAEATGDDTYIPSATSQNLEAGSYREITIINEGASDINTGSDDAVKILVGNTDRSGQPTFSGRRAISDLIPGVDL